MNITEDYSFLNSLDVSTLEHLLSTHPATASLLPQSTFGMDEAEADKTRKDEKRKRLRDVKIPIPLNPERRRLAEQDTELWLRTYLPDLFFEDFTDDRREMANAIDHAAQYGGDKAIAGPRGEGKTTLAIWCAVKLMFCGKCDFPVVIGKSQGKAQSELKDIKERLQQSQLLYADYPEVCVPMRAVGAWSSKARMQTVQGVQTNIVLAADHLAFPTIGRHQLPKNWPADIEPASCGQVLYCLGVDGPIRGTKFRGKRPQLAILDDIESRESAASDKIIAANEDIIEKDVAGLGASGKRVARTMLCTIQNRKCIAYKYTDPTLKPSWNGRRYRKMLKPPDEIGMPLVEKYIEMRQLKTADDPDARLAHKFWRDNQKAIEANCIVSNYQSYNREFHPDGDPLEWSAIQAYYNRVADFGADSVATEIDNDPPETAGPQGNGLTPDMVCSRISGLARCQLPADTVALTAGIDLGKYRCHWVVIAWRPGAGGCVVDYGVAEVFGNDNIKHEDQAQDMEASEPAIYRALLNWRDDLTQKAYVDATGTPRKVDFVFIDSSSYTHAAYEFCRQVRGIYHPCKGTVPFYPKNKSTDSLIAGSNIYATKNTTESVWLYHLDTNYWKQWTHERFMSPTFDEQNMLRRGALSLFMPEGNHRHLSYAQHITAEELLTEFKEGKGVKTYWSAKTANNHWLDATYMACAATEAVNVKLLQPSEQKVEARHVNADAQKQKPVKTQYQHGNRFRSRPGGWIQGVRRR